MKYNTKQREILINFFQENIDNKFTAKEIYDVLKEQNISLSAIYRNLSDMKVEGLIKSFIRNDQRDICYQFVKSECCKEKLHITCNVCGKIFHADEDTVNKIVKLLKKSDNFMVDVNTTSISGMCSTCLEKKTLK